MTVYICTTVTWADSRADKKVNKWQLSWPNAPELTSQPSWHPAIDLVKHCQADKTQWILQYAAGQSSHTWGESWKLMQHVELIWQTCLNSQGPAELTICTWADLLHMSPLIAAEPTKCSWVLLIYSSWAELQFYSRSKVPCLSMNGGQMKSHLYVLHMCCTCQHACEIRCTARR